MKIIIPWRQASGLALSIMLATLVEPAEALTETGQISVSANVINQCLVTPQGNLSFADSDGLSDDTLEFVITVSCTSPVIGATLDLNNGLHANEASPTQRRMESGGNFLEYNLFTDASHTQIWLDGEGGTGHGVMDGVDVKNFTVYAKRLATPGAVAGSYSDTVTYTLTYP